VLEVSILGQEATRRTARMSTDFRQATDDYSRAKSGFRSGISRSRALRAGLAIVAGAGLGLLVVATFTTIIQITVAGSAKVASGDTRLSGWDRHGPALLVIAVFAAVMIPAALRGSRAAMAALVACGAATLLVALAWDLPDLHETGLFSELYTDASAGPHVGYYAETLGGVLLLAAGGGMLLAGPRGARAVSD
jgi:hypothetical protein